MISQKYCIVLDHLVKDKSMTQLLSMFRPHNRYAPYRSFDKFDLQIRNYIALLDEV